MQSLIRHIFQLTSAAVVFCTLLSYACPYVDPSNFSWLAFLGTAYPWLLLFNVILLLFWLWQMNRFALYHLAILLFGWQHLRAFIGLDIGKNKVPESAIMVASHNLGGIYQGKTPNDSWRENRVEAYAKFLHDNKNPDILCTQETSGKFYRLLAEKMGYTHSFNLKKGTVILSRFPIEAGGDVPFGKTANSILWTDVRVAKNKIIRVYNVHLQSNRVSQTAQRVIEKGELDEGETWHNIGFMLDRVGDATSIRAEQAKQLREHILASKYPVVVCGDFNDTPNSFVYATLSEGLTDTFKEKGLGLGTTFAGSLPLLRIDYILTEKSITPFSCDIPNSPVFSDHYPVFSQIGF
jgi:endonuclease/exonuclease/phosphatase family metal-dependent hydrolase